MVLFAKTKKKEPCIILDKNAKNSLTTYYLLQKGKDILSEKGTIERRGKRIILTEKKISNIENKLKKQVKEALKKTNKKYKKIIITISGKFASEGEYTITRANDTCEFTLHTSLLLDKKKTQESAPKRAQGNRKKSKNTGDTAGI